MAQSILELIFKTSKQGQGGKAAAQELKDLKGTVGEVTSGMLGMNLGALSAVGAVMAVGGAVVDATKGFIDYGETIRGLEALTGSGVEATSRLMQAFDDLGVSQEEFTTLASGAAKKGFVMTIDNVANLADEYQGLSTQEEKNALLTDRLGKSAFTAAKAFQAGGQAIRDAAAAQADGLVLTEKEAEAAEKARVRIDELNDAWEALKLTVGGWVAGGAMDQLDRLELLQKATAATGVSTGTMTKAQQDEVIAIYQSNEAHAKAYTAMARLQEITDRETEATHGAAEGFGALPTRIQAYITATDAAANSSSTLGAVISDQVAAAMQDYTTQLQFQIASEGLSAEAKMRLAEAFGLVDEKSKYAAARTAEWKSLLENGKITIAQYTAMVTGLADQLQRVESKDVTITTHLVTVGETIGRTYDPLTGTWKANAGTFTVPPGYPNDSYPVWMSSGETANITNDRMRWTGQEGGGGGGGPTVNVGPVYISNGMDMATFEARLADVLRRRK